MRKIGMILALGVSTLAPRPSPLLAQLGSFNPLPGKHDVYAIRNAKIVTVSGPTIEHGTVVIGRAASRLPAQVTDIVALGSPGMDVARATDLGTTARIWAGSGPGGWTLRLPDLRLFGAGHGTNPTRAGFGARILDMQDAVGHDGYSSSFQDLGCVDVR